MEASHAQMAKPKVMDVDNPGPKVYVDRRNCTRVVPMKALCLGQPRTGTLSMRIALMQLGLYDVYHMAELWGENPKDDDLWVEAFQAKYEGKGNKWGRKEWDALTGHCMAVSDMPIVCFSEDLIATYPEAKVILTVRDNVEVWYESITNTILTGTFLFSFPKSTFQAFLQKIAPRPEAWRTLQYCYEYSALKDFETRGIEYYNEYNDMVRSSVPKENLLEFNVKQGWGPLCEFLGLPVPDLPFPRVNDTKAWRAHVNTSKRQAAMKLLGYVGMLGVVAAGVYFRSTGWGR